MKEEIIKHLKEHLSKRQEPEIQALLNALPEMDEGAVKGVAILVLDTEQIVSAFKRNYTLKHAYDKKN